MINSQQLIVRGIRYSPIMNRPTAPRITLDKQNQNITNGGGVFFSFLINIIDIEIDMAAINAKNTPSIVDDHSIVGTLIPACRSFNNVFTMLDDVVKSSLSIEFVVNIEIIFISAGFFSFICLFRHKGIELLNVIKDVFNDFGPFKILFSFPNKKLGRPISTTPINVVKQLIICNGPNASFKRKWANIAMNTGDVKRIVVASPSGIYRYEE